MRLLLDEMLPTAVSDQLERRGHDVATVVDLGLGGEPDSLIWAATQANSYVLVTEDTDFRDIVAEFAQLGRPHSGVIFTSTRRFPPGDQRTVGRLVTALDALLASGTDLTDREYWLA